MRRIGMAFAGPCSAVFAVMLLPDAAFLSLDGEGFTTCPLFRKRRMDRRDAGPFGAVRVGRRALMGDDSAGRTARRPRLAATNVGLFGFGCASPDTYGSTVPELAAFMNAARRRALAASW